MTLVLNVIRAPSGLAPERREVSGQSFSIGRGRENDWVLADPDRVLSKQHCQITTRGNGWDIVDRSSNGTALNGDSLDPDQPHALQDGDRLTVGAYEIEVRLRNGAPHAAPQPTEDRIWQGITADDLNDRRLTSDPFSTPGNDLLESAQPGVGLPSDFDPLSDDEGVGGQGYTAPNHVSDLRENFQPPRPSLELLPADWDADEPPPVNQPVPPVAPAIPPLDTPTAPPPAAPTQPSDDGPGQSGLAAFTAGAGISGMPPGDPDTVLRSLGAAFRAVVSGLRRMMIARSAIKGEFRIEQTMIRAAGNNPLKFSADDDDALCGLLGIGRKLGMSPDRALAEALRDMRLHELAVATAMQQAVRDLLAELGPERIGGDVPNHGLGSFAGRLLGQRQRTGWDAYCRRHAAMMRALSDDFDSVFGKSFVRAYEAALASIAAQDAEDPS